MAEILKSIDSSDLAEAIAELNRRIEQADSLDRCIAKECPLLEVLRELSKIAMARLVEVDPSNTIRVIQYQQTAKLFDAVTMTIETRLQDGNAAAVELNDIKEDGYGG